MKLQSKHFEAMGSLRWCLQGELAAESGNTAMKSAEIAAKAVLVTGETFFFQRFENGQGAWRFVGSNFQDSSQPPGSSHFFGLGSPT